MINCYNWLNISDWLPSYSSIRSWSLRRESISNLFFFTIFSSARWSITWIINFWQLNAPLDWWIWLYLTCSYNQSLKLLACRHSSLDVGFLCSIIAICFRFCRMSWLRCLVTWCLRTVSSSSWHCSINCLTN